MPHYCFRSDLKLFELQLFEVQLFVLQLFELELFVLQLFELQLFKLSTTDQIFPMLVAVKLTTQGWSFLGMITSLKITLSKTKS